MFTLYLREEPAPDDAIVLLRAGVRSVALGKLETDSRRSERTIGVLGVSVTAALPGETLRQAWARSVVTAERDVVWRSTAGLLRSAGFVLLPTGSNPRHYTVVLPRLSEEWLVRFAAQFTREVRK
jgi:hypothetical protein